VGRRLSRDPVGEKGDANLYATCQNDPVNAVDPLGLKLFVAGELIRPNDRKVQELSAKRGLLKRRLEQYLDPKNPQRCDYESWREFEDYPRLYQYGPIRDLPYDDTFDCDDYAVGVKNNSTRLLGLPVFRRVFGTTTTVEFQLQDLFSAFLVFPREYDQQETYQTNADARSAPRAGEGSKVAAYEWRTGARPPHVGGADSRHFARTYKGRWRSKLGLEHGLIEFDDPRCLQGGIYIMTAIFETDEVIVAPWDPVNEER
jgi:hypothetical protein